METGIYSHLRIETYKYPLQPMVAGKLNNRRLFN